MENIKCVGYYYFFFWLLGWLAFKNVFEACFLIFMMITLVFLVFIPLNFSLNVLIGEMGIPVIPFILFCWLKWKYPKNKYVAKVFDNWKSVYVVSFKSFYNDLTLDKYLCLISYSLHIHNTVYGFTVNFEATDIMYGCVLLCVNNK